MRESDAAACAFEDSQRAVPKYRPLNKEVLDIDPPDPCYADILAQAGLLEINPNAPMYRELRDKILEWY